MTIPKFRAWNKNLKTMHGTDDIVFINFEEEEICVQTIYFEQGLPDERDLDFYIFDEIELMQSTGLVDENDKEIFDGDIVVEEYRDSLNYGRVFYSEKKACHRVEFKNLVNGFDLADVAVKFVAGNVYENPALLEGEE